MRFFAICKKLGLAMILGSAVIATGCDDPMAAAIKAEKQSEADKAKADAEKHKADLARETEKDKLALEAEKERNKMELEREKLRQAERNGNTTSTTTIDATVTTTDGGASVGERSQELVKPGDEGQAMGGSASPAAPTSSPASAPTTN